MEFKHDFVCCQMLSENAFTPWEVFMDKLFSLFAFLVW